MEQIRKGAFEPTRSQRLGQEPAADTFHPRYVYAPRLVGRLACGELAVEPVPGPVRVAGIKQPEEEGPDGSHVFVSWRDEHGPGTAAAVPR